MILNSFNALPVPQNPMLEKRILKLSPIGKKLGEPYRAPGGHIGFWALKWGSVVEKIEPHFFLTI